MFSNSSISFFFFWNLEKILEVLYRRQWKVHDGLGAIVLSPTRELAFQIFETLRKIGKRHKFSAGLVFGGKDHKEEVYIIIFIIIILY
jgi:ATP-dependent RNA helicase DDX10/DBP4